MKLNHSSQDEIILDLGCTLHPMIVSLEEKEKEDLRCRSAPGRRSCEDGGRAWSSVATARELQPPAAGRGEEGLSP